MKIKEWLSVAWLGLKVVGCLFILPALLIYTALIEEEDFLDLEI